MVLLACAAASLAIMGLSIYCGVLWLSPDGLIYLAAARGEAVPRPFHLRPLLPMVLGEAPRNWRIASFLGLFVAAVSIGSLAVTAGLGLSRAVAASALFSGLSIVRYGLDAPVLVDGPALGFAGLSAALAASGHGVAAAAVALIGAGVKEHVPIFAAIAGWSLWPLLGVLVTVTIWLAVKPAPSNHKSQSDPLAHARAKQNVRLLSAAHVVLPWGACLAAMWAPTLPAVASLVAAYAMLLVSADSTRIYQWAAIPVCVAAAAVIPQAWLLPCVIAHLVNPWRGDM